MSDLQFNVTCAFILLLYYIFCFYLYIKVFKFKCLNTLEDVDLHLRYIF